MYSASMYAIGYLPLEACKTTEQIKGVNVLEEMTVKQGSLRWMNGRTRRVDVCGRN